MCVTSHVKDGLLVLPLLDFCPTPKIHSAVQKQGISLLILTSWHCIVFVVLSSVGVMGKYILCRRSIPVKLKHTKTCHWKCSSKWVILDLFSSPNVRYSVPVLNQCRWPQPGSVWSDRLSVNSLVNPAKPLIISDNNFLLLRHSTQLTKYACLCAYTQYMYYMCVRLTVGVQKKLHSC